MELRAKEKQEYNSWLSEKAAIKRQGPQQENPITQRKRIKNLLLPGHETLFFKYYFNHLIDCDFAYFQKRDVKYIAGHKDTFAVMEWPREHAKSVIWDIMMPLYLKARGELSGMVIASSNESKADALLSDIQSELMFNIRYINDFGPQYNQGKWTDGQFSTIDGIGFWAFGRGQSPRGLRELDKRPNYAVADDIDDKVLVRNEARVDDTVNWVLEDLYGALPITGSRLLIIGNRIHKKSVLAKIVGDVENDDPEREGIYHSKVFALENPKTHKKELGPKGVPAWKRFTKTQLECKFKRMGKIRALREYFHEHTEEGTIFTEDQLPWTDILPLGQYDALITYNDPSYRKSATSDCKAIVLMGKKGRYYDIIDIFCRQCSTAEMVRAHYSIAAQVPGNLKITHWMEANFIQDMMLEAYWNYGEENPPALRIRGDKRSKPDKEVRIENLSPLTEQCFIRFNKELKHKPDMQELRHQFLGFPNTKIHDDGPDAIEGGIYKLDKKKGKNKGNRKIKIGQYTRDLNRSIF